MGELKKTYRLLSDGWSKITDKLLNDGWTKKLK
jgi:hypothetical protein